MSEITTGKILGLFDGLCDASSGWDTEVAFAARSRLTEHDALKARVEHLEKRLRDEFATSVDNAERARKAEATLEAARPLLEAAKNIDDVPFGPFGRKTVSSAARTLARAASAYRARESAKEEVKNG